MLTLYHSVDARSFRALWCLEELGLPYRLRMLPFPPRELSPDYLQENPLGTVPLLVDGETRMTESAAICHYLCVRHGGGRLAVAPGHADYGAYLNWLHFGEATLTVPQTIVLRYGRFEPKERRIPQAVEDYSRWFMARLRAVEAAVSTHDHLCPSGFTAADISAGYGLFLAEVSGLDRSFKPATAAYWARLTARPAFAAARAAEARASRDQGVPVSDIRAEG